MRKKKKKKNWLRISCWGSEIKKSADGGDS